MQCTRIREEDEWNENERLLCNEIDAVRKKIKQLEETLFLRQAALSRSSQDQTPCRDQKCPKGHKLLLQASQPGVCDGCKRRTTGGELVMECKGCNYYLCRSCHPQAVAKAQVDQDISGWNGISLRHELERLEEIYQEQCNLEEEVLLKLLTATGSTLKSFSNNRKEHNNANNPNNVVSNRSGAQEELGSWVSDLTLEELSAVQDPSILLGEESSYSLNWDRRWAHQSAGPRDWRHRNYVREGTKDKVAKMLGLRYFGEDFSRVVKKPPQCTGEYAPVLVKDQTEASTMGSASSGGENLFGRYDVLCMRVCADFDRNWGFIKAARNDFWVAHAAALNIGEHAKAPDFGDFCKQPGYLDEEAYFEGMEHIMRNIVTACDTIKAEHMIFFPFGMGAFARHLGLLDPKYTSDEEQQRFRRRLTNCFVEALKASSPKMHVHICLQFDREEAMRNGDAFIRALVRADAALKKRCTIWPEGDCLHLAHELATCGDSSYGLLKPSPNVVLVNGANRKLIGNHWFANSAMRAIDENLHRRSWRMAAMAYLINSFSDFNDDQQVTRGPEELEQRTCELGGKVQYLKPGKGKR